ncbi:MAG: 4Fe-4S dicluster domain-containing protein [Dehalobacterium sp.]|jgi:Na+-translocating ferredoxin:NAD+ oxidoreductase RnfC subunit
MKNKIAELARDAGVIGAGGAGFPTHIKLNTRVEYVILNGAECEPLSSVDQILLETRAQRLSAMLEEVREALRAKVGIIGIKAKHAGVIQVVKDALISYPNLKVMLLGDYYPAGDEVELVFETTGRQIPQGGIPLDTGVVVINVETLWNLAEAKKGLPVTQKWVTVAGAVPIPGTFQVPLGVSIGEMLKLAGDPVLSEFAVINGGPMMGKLVHNLSEPVTKTTKALLVLPKTNPVVQNNLRPLAAIYREAQAICCQCQICTDLCPRNLLGYNLHPHQMILTAGYKGQVQGTRITEAYLCSECGVCDLFACPMGLSPRRVNQTFKKELVRLGISNPYKGSSVTVHPWRNFRRIPTKRLKTRLGLDDYDSSPPLRFADIFPEKVEIPLNQHIGIPAEPIVKKGDVVEKGYLIGKIPEEGKLSSNYHASISGRILEVTEESIVINYSDV